MIYFGLGLLLLWVILGGRRAGAALRRAWPYWRPTAGVLTMAMLAGALFLAVREDWIAAAVLAIAGVFLAVAARRRRSNQAPSPNARMSKAEASAILGVGPNANAEEIQAAYRRLIRLAHPDAGGTKGLAAQLNAARAALLGGKTP